MKEENIDSRIERAIKDLASKKAQMAQWETECKQEELRRSLSLRKRRIYYMSVAASVVVIVFVGIGMYFNNTVSGPKPEIPAAPVYRGGSVDMDEIEGMMDSAKYEEAIKAIDITLTDTIIDKSLPVEQQNYIRELQKQQSYDITWLKIQCLLKVGKKDEAVTLLRNYAGEDGTHKSEAQQLLEDLPK